MNPNLETLDKITDVILAYRPKPMDELLHFVNQGSELYVDSREIAKMFGVQHESLMVRWTNRFIYEPVFAGLPAELKAKRAQYSADSGKDAEWMRLHQFIEENAKEELREHLAKITGFLQIAKNRQDFLEYFVALFGGGKQDKWDEFDDDKT